MTYRAIMRRVESLTGLLFLIKTVKNWYSVMAVYFKIIPTTKARFKDGTEVAISMKDYDIFHEEFFRRYLQEKGFTYKGYGEKTMVHTPDGLDIIFPKVPYSFNLNEVFVTRIYGGDELSGRVVIDLGTYFAESPLYFASKGATKVYGFEPNFENYKLGQENIKLNNMGEKVHIYNEEATFESIKNLINLYGLNDIFLKMDCEGCEYDVILNADIRTFENITDIAMEYHGEPKPLISKLTKLGFITKTGLIIRSREGKSEYGMIYSTRKKG